MLAVEALFDPDLSDGEVRALAVLAHYAWSIDSETFEMTGDQLATLLGKSRKRAVERVAALEAAGHLRIEGRRGLNRPNRYTVRLPRNRHTRRPENGTTGWVGNDAPGWVENDAPSTTTDTRDEKTSGAVDELRVACGHCDHGWRENEQGQAVRCGCLDAPPAF